MHSQRMVSSRPVRVNILQIAIFQFYRIVCSVLNTHTSCFTELHRNCSKAFNAQRITGHIGCCSVDCVSRRTSGLARSNRMIFHIFALTVDPFSLFLSRVSRIPHSFFNFPLVS